MNEMIKPFATVRRCSDVIRELQKHNHPLNVVYDIGCNDGRWTRECKTLLPSAQYIMFDANPENNVSVSGFDKFFHSVLSNDDGKVVKFWMADPGKENTGNSYYKELTTNYSKNRHIELKTSMLDTVVAENYLPQPDFVKIDTQGSESDVINGAHKTLANAKLVLIEVPIMNYNNGAPGFTSYIDLLYNNGFVPTGIDHIAIRNGILNQVDITFVKSDINQEINKHRDRYTGFI